MNILKGLFELIKSDIKNEEKKETNKSTTIIGKIVHENDHVDIVSTACSVCYGTKLKEDRESKLDYIARRIKTGHESILEHSNIVMYFTIYSDIYNLDTMEVLTHCKYLNTKMKTKDNKFHLIIGGSIRGYKHLIKNIENADNKLAREIINLLYELPEEYFYDFIEDGIMDRYKFKITKYKFKYDEKETEVQINDNDQSVKLLQREANILKPIGVFNPIELLDMYTLTFFFKGMSRYTSHQLVRHRNAITQASQRYINQSSAKFNSPALYKESYDKEYQIFIPNSESPDTTCPWNTMNDIANSYINNYKRLREYGVEKQDARALLPEGTQTSLYMTFTISNLIKFLELRTHSSAQTEIRLYAKAIEDIVQTYIEDRIKTNIYNTLMPKYKKEFIENNDYSEIDEVLETKTEKIDINTEDETKLEEMIETSEKLTEQEVTDISDAINKFIVDDEELDLSDPNNFE